MLPSLLARFADVVDLAQFLAQIVTKERSNNVTPPSTSLSTDDLEIIAKRAADFNLSTLMDVVGMWGMNNEEEGVYDDIT